MNVLCYSSIMLSKTNSACDYFTCTYTSEGPFNLVFSVVWVQETQTNNETYTGNNTWGNAGKTHCIKILFAIVFQ